MNEPQPTSSVAGWTVYRPVATLMMVVAVVVFGYISYRQLPVNLMPELSYPTLTIRTELIGAAPAEIEETITRPIEEIVRTVEGVVGVSSTSRAGQSEIVLQLAWDTDMDYATQKVRERVQIVPLPEDAEIPLLLRYDPALDPIMKIGIAGTIPMAELRRLVEQDIQRPLEKVEGIAMVKVRGGVEEVVRVDLDPGRMGLLGVSAKEVGQRLSSENVNLAGGALSEGDVTYLVRTLNAFETIEEVRGLIVAYPDGVSIKLEQVADIYKGTRDREVITHLGDSEGVTESIIVEVFKEADTNLVEVSNRLKDTLYGSQMALADRAKLWGDDRARRVAGAARLVASKEVGMVTGRPSLRTEIIVDGLPANTRVEILSEQATFIERSIDEVTSAAFWGGIFAILVLFLFLRNFWSTVIIAISIPISVISAFGALRLAGVSLNIMSLGGIALGIGMLVDNSIVVLESIFRCREEGDGLFEAALRGTREVAGAVTASTMTTIAVFLPIVFVEGIAGQIFGDLALSVVFSLIASLAVAVFFVPMLSARQPGGLKPESFRMAAATLTTKPISIIGAQEDWSAWRAAMLEKPALWRTLLTPIVAILLLTRGIILLAAELVFARLLLSLVLIVAGVFALVSKALLVVGKLLAKPLLGSFDAMYGLLEKIYVPLLKGALRQRVLVAFAAVGLFVWSVYLFNDLGTELLPAMNQGEFSAELKFPVGTRLEETEKLLRSFENELTKIEGLDRFATTIGVERTDVQASDEGEHTARIGIRLKQSADPNAAERRIMLAVRDLASTIPAANFEIKRPTLFSFETPLSVVILGDDLRLLRMTSDDVEAQMLALDELADVHSNLGRGYPEVQIRFNRDRLAAYGLTARDVGESIRNQVRGLEPTEIRQEDEDVGIIVRTDPEEFPDVDALNDLIVRPMRGLDSEIRLSSVAELKTYVGPSEIRRVDGNRAAIIAADVPLVSLSAAADAVQLLVDRTSRPPGVDIEVAGQSDEMKTAQDSLLFALWLAIFLVYVVLASKFESLRGPFVILLSIPLSLIGVALALTILGVNVSVLVFIGLIMLAGIVVNNAIVLVDYINQLRDRGLEMNEAIVKACTIRLRPVLITTLTTVLGLLPMALGLGEGAELRKPMALTVIAGLSSATILTLVVVPILYALMMRITVKTPSA